MVDRDVLLVRMLAVVIILAVFVFLFTRDFDRHFPPTPQIQQTR